MPCFVAWHLINCLIIIIFINISIVQVKLSKQSSMSHSNVVSHFDTSLFRLPITLMITIKLVTTTRKTHGKTDQNWPLLYKKKHAKNTKLKHKAKPAGLVHMQELLIWMYRWLIGDSCSIQRKIVTTISPPDNRHWNDVVNWTEGDTV